MQVRKEERCLKGWSLLMGEKPKNLARTYHSQDKSSWSRQKKKKKRKRKKEMIIQFFKRS